MRAVLETSDTALLSAGQEILNSADILSAIVDHGASTIRRGATGYYSLTVSDEDFTCACDLLKNDAAEKLRAELASPSGEDGQVRWADQLENPPILIVSLPPNAKGTAIFCGLIMLLGLVIAMGAIAQLPMVAGLLLAVPMFFGVLHYGRMAKDAAVLEISPTGVALRHGRDVCQWSWKEMSHFRVAELAGQKRVVFDLKQGQSGTFSPRTVVNQDALARRWKMDVPDLADLLKSAQARWGTQ